MWGQEKEEERSSTEQEREEVTNIAPDITTKAAEAIIAFVGKGVEFKGTISYSGTVRIDGCLDGEIHTDGVLLVGGKPSSMQKSRPAQSYAREKSPEILSQKNG